MMRMRGSGWETFLCAAVLLLACSGALAPRARATPPLGAATPVIVDTDAGTDDMLALAFLLGRGDVHIEAITVVNGMAHVPAGAANVLALLQLAGHPEIPVYEGSAVPLVGRAAFPASWRKTSDELPGVDLPKATAKPQAESAVAYLTRRLNDTKRPVRILALGPLTNLGAVLRQNPFAIHTIEEMVIMGGAVRVPGNLGDGGAFKTDNTKAEWNFYLDPLAASIVFGSKASIRLIPLDATQQAPIRADFVKTLTDGAKTPLEKFAAQVLASDATLIKQGYFYAWDPLAAMALVDVDAVQVTPLNIQIDMTGIQQGRTVETQGGVPNARVALTAEAARFRREFLAALATAPAVKAQPAVAAPAAKPTSPPATTPAKPPATATPAPQSKPAQAAPNAPAAPAKPKP
jgi:pyrimidine-specific ribonucleoside hydrolase